MATLLIAAAVLAAGIAAIRLWPLFDTRGIDRSLAVYWPEPHLVFEPDPQAGPVLNLRVLIRATLDFLDEFHQDCKPSDTEFDPLIERAVQQELAEILLS